MKCLPVLLTIAACAKPAPQQPAAGGATIAAVAELGLLMKNEINPSFSRLTFLMFHGDSVESDDQSLVAELGRSASQLRGSIARLRAWRNVPAQSLEGRDVFFTYAESVDTMTEKLVVALSNGEQGAAETQLEAIADTCNNCHHFFRLKIEDSIVPSKSARNDRTAAVMPAALPTELP